MIYLSESVVGKGLFSNPRRPAGWDQQGSDWIWLPKTDRSILLLPSPSSDPALTLLASDKDEALGPASKQALSSKLGIDVELSKASDVVAEILTATDRAWPAIQPTKEGFFEYSLGGQKWYSDKAVKGGSTATSNLSNTENPLSESGTFANSAIFGAIQSAGGVAKPASTNQGSMSKYVATFDSNHSTRIYVSARSNNNQLQGAGTRIQSGGECYLLLIDYGTNTSLSLYSIDSGEGFTAIGSSFTVSAQTPAFNITLASNGSTHTISLAGSSQGTRTDAGLSGGVAGFYLYAESSVDNSEITQIDFDGISVGGGKPAAFFARLMGA